MPPHEAASEDVGALLNAGVAPASQKGGKRLTWAEIARHNTPKDCWIVIRGKVYAVHDFVKAHPGGHILLTYGGEDATDVFAAFHPSSTTKMLPELCVGEVADEVRPSDFVSECRRLRTVFKDAGYMESSKLYYAFKIASNLAIAMASLALLANFSHPAVVAVAGLLLALFWQQCGWLAHDFLHHQVFLNRSYNNLVGYVVGNWWQGFSVAWWKNKHNTHHAVPNVHKADPDVDLMPLLAWSEHALDAFMDGDFDSLPKFMIDHQMFVYPLLLCVARVSWAVQSVLWVLQRPDTHQRLAEMAGLLAHWATLAAILITWTTPMNALVYVLASNAGCGLLLAAVFSLNHNGMPIYTKDESRALDYYTRQVLTGRDVIPSLIVNWFTGGLNYQIEHHLFPQVPRHHFHKIQPLVQALCRKHGVSYHRTSFVGGTREVFQRLAQVGGASKAIQAKH